VRDDLAGGLRGLADAAGRSNCTVCVGVGLYLRGGRLKDLKRRNRRLLPLTHFNNGTPEAEVAALLDDLPVNVVISVESPNRTRRSYAAREWCQHTLGSRRDSWVRTGVALDQSTEGYLTLRHVNAREPPVPVPAARKECVLRIREGDPRTCHHRCCCSSHPGMWCCSTGRR
jgi:hypothetical protein